MRGIVPVHRSGFDFIPIAVVLVVLWLWITSLMDLMNRRDDEFPGKYDKLAWTAIILVLPALGGILYFLRKRVDTGAEEHAKRMAEMLATPPDMPDTVQCPECKRPMLATAEKCMYCGWKYFQSES